jgi:hypothetical protein
MLTYLAVELSKEAKYTITEFTMKHRKNLSEFAGLEVELPKFDLPAPEIEVDHSEVQPEHDTEHDDEGAMVKADLFKLAKYSVKLFKKIEDEDQFESWVQAKITKASDYISSVYHYLEYEMKFSEYGEKLENSDVYSESQKRELKGKLMEAKKSLAAMKIAQSDKLDNEKKKKDFISESSTNFDASDLKGLENIDDLHELKKQAFALITKPSKRPTKPEKVQYAKNQLANMKTPAQVIAYMWQQLLGGEGMRVIGSRNSTQPSNYASRFDNVDEGFTEECSACGGAGHVAKQISGRAKKLADKHVKLHNFIDKKFKDLNGNGIDDRLEGDTEVDEEAITPVKKPSGVADKKGNNPFAKKDEKKSGNGDAFKKELDNAKTKSSESAKTKSSESAKTKSSESAKPKSTTNSQDTGNPYASKAKTESVYEAKKKPSEGLSAAKKSATVKDAKAGGGEKGKKIAAAAMWKNVKESVAYLEEKKALEKADKDYDSDGKIESGKDEHKGSIDKAITASKEKECIKESVELSRLREITSRVIR